MTKLRAHARKAIARELAVYLLRSDEFSAVRFNKAARESGLIRDQTRVDRHKMSGWLQDRSGKGEQGARALFIEMMNHPIGQSTIEAPELWGHVTSDLEDVEGAAGRETLPSGFDVLDTDVDTDIFDTGRHVRKGVSCAATDVEQSLPAL